MNVATVRTPASSTRNQALLGLFAIFQFADFFTTNYALGHYGLGEANPAMAWCFSSLGILGLAFGKVVLLGFTALAINSIPRWSMVLMVLISAVAAGNNIVHVAPVVAL